MTDLDKAREWAEDGKGLYSPGSRAKAVTDIILSLPDQWVDAEKVREVTDRHNDLIVDFLDQFVGDMHTDTWEAIRDFMCELNVEVDALATPKLPTLADMSEEERAACVGMQADYSPLGEPVERVAIMGITEFGAILMSQNWERSHREAGRITPLPELPKLEWPIKVKTEDEPETTDSSSIHTPMQPSEVPPNEPWLIEVDGQKAIGTRHKGSTIVPWSVAALDGSFAGDFHDNEVTLIHKLVPESPALPEGMRLADYALYGRVVTSPWVDGDDDYKIFFLNEDARGGADYDFAKESELTFLDGGN